MFQRLWSEWDWCGQHCSQLTVTLKASLEKESAGTLLVLEPLAALGRDSEAHQPRGCVCFMSGFLLGSSTAHSSVLARLLAKGAPDSGAFSCHGHQCNTLYLYSALWITSFCPPINSPVASQGRPTWLDGQGIYMPEITQEARTILRSKPMSKFPVGRQGGPRATLLSVGAAGPWQVLLQKPPGWVLWSWSLVWGVRQERRERRFGLGPEAREPCGERWYLGGGRDFPWTLGSHILELERDCGDCIIQSL